MPTAKEFQESECPQLRSFRNLNAHSQEFQESECPQLRSFRNLNAHSQEFQESECHSSGVSGI